ncbi:MAG: DUF2065 domain-containing protein [Pseudomonadota bacterium]
MNDLLVALGLVLVIEGLLWALVPQIAVRMLEIAAGTPERQLRVGGWLAVLAGLVVVWLVRG